MSDLTLAELERDDRVSIDAEPLAGPLWRVSDTGVKDLGIIKVHAVTLVSESEGWSLLGTGDEYAVMSVEDDTEFEIDSSAVTVHD